LQIETLGAKLEGEKSLESNSTPQMPEMAVDMANVEEGSVAQNVVAEDEHGSESATLETVDTSVVTEGVIDDSPQLDGEPEVTSEFSQELVTRIEDLTQQIESLKSQLDDRSNQYMRIVADFENFRRRTQREKEEQEQQIKCTTLTELLPVVDNFERARAQIKPQSDSEMTIHKSYQGVYKQFVDSLKRLGVSPMRPEGQEFDPNLHEAVMREQTADHPEGVVIEELVRGYLLGDRVIRHAMVKVAAAPDPVVTSEGETPDESPS